MANLFHLFLNGPYLSFYLPLLLFFLTLSCASLVGQSESERDGRFGGVFLGFLYYFFFLLPCFICPALFLRWFSGASTVRILEYNIVRLDLHGIGK